MMPSDEGQSFRLLSIEKKTDNTYTIVVMSSRGSSIETICHVSRDTKRNIELIKFESEEFNKAIMHGEIQVKTICSVVSAFEKEGG